VNLTRSSALALLSSVCACLRPNPAFDLEAGDDASEGLTTVVSAGGSSGASSMTGEASSGAPDTSGGAPTSSSGTSTSDAEVTGDPLTGGDSTGGGAAKPGTYEVPASIGSCVFVGVMDFPVHGGPDECRADADAINNSALSGLMMLDVQVDDNAGMSRPAHPYLRFDVPAEFSGLMVTAATLHIQVADNVTDLPQSGELWSSEPFDEAVLNMKAPKLIALIAADKGEVQPDEWLTWSLDPEQVMAGKPLFFGLQPTHNKGVMLRGGTTTPGSPYLELDLQ
jgi:hypothetical protein